MGEPVVKLAPLSSRTTPERTPAVGLDELSSKFGWLQGIGKLFTGKQLIAKARFELPVS